MRATVLRSLGHTATAAESCGAQSPGHHPRVLFRPAPTVTFLTRA